MSWDQEAQDDELLALASIYDEEEFCRAESGREGEIHLCLELPRDFKLLVVGEAVLNSLWCVNLTLMSSPTSHLSLCVFA